MQYEKKAFALRDRVSEREKFGIDTVYYWVVTGELEKEMETEELHRQAYPRDYESANDLAVDDCFFLGQFEKAIEMGNEATRLSPHVIGAYGAVGCGYLGLNRAEEARTFLENALANNPDSSGIHYNLYAAYSALEDEAGGQRELEWASGKVQAAAMVGFLAAGRAAQRGKLKRAREFSMQALQISKGKNFKDSAAGFAAFQALSEAEIGNLAQTARGRL